MLKDEGLDVPERQCLNTPLRRMCCTARERKGKIRWRAGEGDYLPNSATASERETSTSSRVTSASSRVAGM